MHNCSITALKTFTKATGVPVLGDSGNVIEEGPIMAELQPGGVRSLARKQTNEIEFSFCVQLVASVINTEKQMEAGFPMLTQQVQV